MKLAPREVEKLALHGAGFLAQKRLARGLKLNYTEAVALIAAQVLPEFLVTCTILAVIISLGRICWNVNVVLALSSILLCKQWLV